MPSSTASAKHGGEERSEHLSALPAHSVWIEKINGRGEDSAVFIEKIVGDQLIVLGVFDGLGGSGGRLLRLEDGSEKSAARVASDLAFEITREVVDQYFSRVRAQSTEPLLTSGATPQGIERFSGELQQKLHEGFAQRASALGSEKPVIRGSLSRRLPTTLCVVVANGGRGSTEIWALWAGDSRAYLWTPDQGLAQLTADHTRQPLDAFESLHEDAPMANFITPDLDFYVQCHKVTASGPCIVLCASDGCFHYFQSPMEFECELLDALAREATWTEAVDAFGERMREITMDDVSLAIAGFNWPGDLDYKTAAQQRLASLQSWREAPADREDAAALEAHLKQWWEQYRGDYERALPLNREADS